MIKKVHPYEQADIEGRSPLSPPPPRDVDENHRSGIATRPPTPRDVDKNRRRGTTAAVGAACWPTPPPVPLRRGPLAAATAAFAGFVEPGDVSDRDAVLLTCTHFPHLFYLERRSIMSRPLRLRTLSKAGQESKDNEEEYNAWRKGGSRASDCKKTSAGAKQKENNPAGVTAAASLLSASDTAGILARYAGTLLRASTPCALGSPEPVSLASRPLLLPQPAAGPVRFPAKWMKILNAKSGKVPPPQPQKASSDKALVLGKPTRRPKWTQLSSAAGSRAQGHATRFNHAESGNESTAELYAKSVQEASNKITNFGPFSLDTTSKCSKISFPGKGKSAYELTIKCPYGCLFKVLSFKLRYCLEKHPRVCPGVDKELHDLKAALEQDDWTYRGVSAVMKVVSNQEKYAAFNGDVHKICSVFSNASEMPDSLSRLKSDERFGGRGMVIYGLVRGVLGLSNPSRGRSVPHWSWYMPKYHKIWTNFGFDDPFQKEKSAKRQKTRR
ncbi:hypothetical protein THAOC_02715 [Thalassiosira oceanica]|uniref:Uncharacterized protein n=1 Tax=Thalassiosira oceanica TaxID=159749 RepID=K0TQ75_THAOC|nr:hypothetical protein THAOC_02715 [Thalassiosira oceanica]|eukprot:EJK75557.1 hypothetical protein THAOC_02715 [Thalassiosira oceanica]